MKIYSKAVLWGIFLILLGLFLLMTSLRIIPTNEGIAVSAIFVSTGIVLVIAYYLYKEKLWALILGMISFFIGSSVYIDESRGLPDRLIGMVFFILTALVFLNGLREGKKNWWVIIPGGFSLVFAAHILADVLWWIPDEYHGVIFFGGAGIIFGVVYLLKDKMYDLDWAKYPSIISFIIMGIILLSIDFDDIFSKLIFPLVLIMIGVLIILKSLKSRESIAEQIKSKTVQEKKKERKGKKNSDQEKTVMDE